MGVLTEHGVNNAHYRMTKGLVLGEQLQGSMSNLLEHVGDTIRLPDFHGACVLVDTSFVPIKPELLPRPHKISNNPSVVRCLDVVVASVLPSSNVEICDMLASFIWGVELRPHF